MQTNPYQSPAAIPSGGNHFAAPPGRPTAVSVFGVLNLVFGIFGIVGTLGTVAMLAMPRAANLPNPVLDLMANNAAYRTISQVSMALGLVAALVLIVAGVGLLRMRPYGRTLSIGYSLYAILAGIVGMVVTFLFVVQPLLRQAQQVAPGPAQGALIGGVIGGTLGGIVSLVYPILLLVFMTRRSIADALRR